MTQVFETAETMQRQYFFLEERQFYNRAKTDRMVGKWVGERLGLGAVGAALYAERAVEAGIVSRDGRGGFDFLVTQLSNIGVRIDELRARYGIAGAGECPALNLVAVGSLSLDH
ncbi:ATPase inhibitor subunit zeta [Devosia sp.]|uniref:ATPase inhibitor subunit zeta n=1 Tax=Devosia sp. TaxID=1871048 RepID=UPI0032649B9D